MAKKKRSRKRRRQQAQTAPRPPAPTAAAEPRVAPARPRPTASSAATQDFVQTYAYVYFDLRKMFTLAAIVFVLLILTNVVLRYLLVL